MLNDLTTVQLTASKMELCPVYQIWTLATASPQIECKHRLDAPLKTVVRSLIKMRNKVIAGRE